VSEAAKGNRNIGVRFLNDDAEFSRLIVDDVSGVDGVVDSK
jgi:hypothetical protein